MRRRGGWRARERFRGGRGEGEGMEDSQVGFHARRSRIKAGVARSFLGDKYRIPLGLALQYQVPLLSTEFLFIVNSQCRGRRTGLVATWTWEPELLSMLPFISISRTRSTASEVLSCRQQNKQARRRGGQPEASPIPSHLRPPPPSITDPALYTGLVPSPSDSISCSSTV